MSNRQQRRARRRHAAKTPVIVAGDGIVAATIPGHTFEARPRKELPTKVPGKHRWIASVSYVLGPQWTSDDLMDGDLPKFLDSENLHYLAIGCWDCEGLLQEVGSKPCPAEADD